MSRPSATDLLRTRIAELDSGRSPRGPYVTDPLLLHFSAVMTTWTAGRVSAELNGSPILDVETADSMTSRCRLLQELSQREPHLVRGPLLQNRQHWIRALRPGSRPQIVVPSEASFVGAQEAAGFLSSVESSTLGIYTSTAATSGHGMWRTFLEFGTEASLLRRPWVVWHLQPEPGVVVFDIDSAQAWQAFVQRYPRVVGGYMYPDWPRVASEVDAVHITLTAIVPTQAFAVPASPYPVAPAYWDVETTLWLRWCFTSVTQIEVVE